MTKLYSLISNHDTILELWGASTKHPDSRFRFSDFSKVDWIADDLQLMQWGLECASKLTFPFFAKDLAEEALKWYELILQARENEGD